MAVPIAAKLPPGDISFASIAVMLGTSVFRAQTTVAWPPLPTAACKPVIVGVVASSPSAEIVAGGPKAPAGPVRTAARTCAVAIAFGFCTHVATAVPPWPTAISLNPPASNVCAGPGAAAATGHGSAMT